MSRPGAERRAHELAGPLLAAVALIAAPLVLVGGCGPVLEPDFEVISQEVFVPSCSFGVCHGADSPQNDLDLSSADAAWETLFDDPVDSTMERVVPGDPDNSLLVQALLGPVDDVEQMPDGGELEAYQIRGITRWVEDGAER